jgi:ligand-binding sensor domain-containing protein
LRNSSTCPERRRRRCRIGAAGLQCALLCLLAGRAQALDPQRALSQYIREQWTSDRGFPGGPVHAITQTADGYLWIAAEKGLIRFDGLTFRRIEPAPATTNGSATPLGVAADPSGALWARMRGPALLRYANGTFERLPSALRYPDTIVTAMSQGNSGSMLLAPLGEGVAAYRGGRLVTLVPIDALPNALVIALAETADGDAWMGTRDSGLLRLHGTAVTRITGGLPDRKINCLLAGAGDLWIGTDRGIVRWNGSAVTAAGLPAALSGVGALAMIRDRDGNVWVVTASGGVLRVNAAGVTTLVDPEDRFPATVTTIFEDREGNIWLGSTLGIERLRDGVFATYAARQGMPSDTVGPVYSDAAGRTWFAPDTGGLYWIEQGHVRKAAAAGMTDDIAYSIAGQGEDLWVGWQKGGLTRLRLHGTHAAAERFTQADGLAQNSVSAVYVARDGAVWAGTLSGGVSRFHAGTFRTYTRADGLASNTVSSILEARDGTMWFATPTGVNVLSHGGWRRYGAEDGLPDNEVHTLAEDASGVIWVGTGNGLAFFDGGAPGRLANTPPVLHGAILGLAEDRLGWFWIATAEGVLRVNRERLRRGDLREEDVRVYGAADGLLGHGGVRRHRSVAAGADGRMWIAMNRGLSVADTGRTAVALPRAAPRVEEIAADGTALAPDGAVSIPPAPGRVTLAYTGLSLSMPERVRFRYRLDGYDHDWSAPVAARQATYTNLGPGSYRFRLMASDADGGWSAPEALAQFTIAPTAWQSWWFRASAVIAAAAAGWGAYRLRTLQLAHRLNVRFEERLAERTRIAQDLHDTLLQGFISASMQLHVTADALPRDSDARPALTRILGLMARVIEEGRNAVRGLRTAERSAEDLAQSLAGLPEELGLAGQARYRVIVEGRARALSVLIRDAVYRITREALMNAFRHAGAEAIDVQIEYSAPHLRVVVTDDGCGMDAVAVQAGREGHWGLSGMRERAVEIGARCTVRSRAGGGTQVEIVVPARVAFEHRKE